MIGKYPALRYCVLGLLLLLTGRHGLAQERAYILGVISYGESAQMITSEYEGLTNYLTRTVKRPVRVEGSRDFTTFAERIKSKRYQFIFAAPSAVLEARRDAGYEPIAKVPGRLAAAFMALSKAGIAFPEDMKGRRIGFTGKDAMITKLAFHELQQLGIKNPEKHFSSIAYYNDAGGVLAGMQMNLIDVGVANAGLFNVWTGRGEDINLIHSGKGVPHLTFAVRGNMPESEKKVIAEALFKASQDKDASEFFKFSGMAGFEPAKMADYDELAKILDIK